MIIISMPLSNHHSEMLIWLTTILGVENYPHSKWWWTLDNWNLEFHFKNKDDAILFKMVWSGNV